MAKTIPNIPYKDKRPDFYFFRIFSPDEIPAKTIFIFTQSAYK